MISWKSTMSVVTAYSNHQHHKQARVDSELVQWNRTDLEEAECERVFAETKRLSSDDRNQLSATTIEATNAKRIGWITMLSPQILRQPQNVLKTTRTGNL